MDHAGGQASDGSEFFRARDGAICFHAIRDLLADGNYVRHLSAVVGPHRNLADHPVTNVTFGRRSFLLDAFDFTALEYTLKLFRQHVARLAREYFEDVLAQY